MSVSEDLKQTAQLRKAIMPLIGLLKSEADAEITKRLDSIEAMMKSIAKPEITVDYTPPVLNVTVETPEELVKSLRKAAEPAPIETPSAYEPHDQAKTQTFQYSGFMRSDGDYYIQRVAKGEQRYAIGKGDYTAAWEKRGDLKYGYINEVK